MRVSSENEEYRTISDHSEEPVSSFLFFYSFHIAILLDKKP